MKIIIGLIVFIYTVVFLALGLSLLGVFSGIITIDQIKSFLDIVYGSSLNLLYVGLVGLVVLILAFLYVYSILKRHQGKKAMSFRNSGGEVSISLGAIEDFIKRISEDVAEIKSLDCKVINTRKKLLVLNNITIWAGINIPEITEKFQNLIKVRLQELLGIEENITVKIYIREVQEAQIGQESTSYGGEIDYSR